MTGVAIALAAAAPASADTIKVHNTRDHGSGSLRKAVQESASFDKIKVPKGHYELSSGEIFIDHEVTITGAGARDTIVDANGESRVFEIDYGAPGTVKFQGLTIREGDTTVGGGAEDGAGIESHTPTKLVLSKVAVLNNRAINNVDWANGGGVYSGGELVIKQSLFAGNHGYNGGAAAGGDDITATDSTFYNNFGGNPTFNGDGGAFDDNVTLIDSTVAGNQCFNGDGCGGGIDGGTLKGTLIADNTAYEQNGMPAGSPGNPGVGDNCSGSIGSQGHNLESHHDCGFAGPTDLFQKNAKLGKLKNNGGPTDTLAIPHTSPAVNAGAAHCTGRDQRGVKRPQGNRCDIGAFELGP